MNYIEAWEHFNKSILSTLQEKNLENIKTYIFDNQDILFKEFWDKIISIRSNLNETYPKKIICSYYISSMIQNQSEKPLFVISANDSFNNVMTSASYDPSWLVDDWYALCQEIRFESKKYFGKIGKVKLEQVLLAILKEHIDLLERFLLDNILIISRQEYTLDWLLIENFCIEFGGCYNKHQKIYIFEE